MRVFQSDMVRDREVVLKAPSRRPWTQYGALLASLLGIVLLGAACGDDNKNADTYDGCLARCDVRSECPDMFDTCASSCSWLQLSGFMGSYFTKAQRECYQGVTDYWMCMSSACTLDEDGYPSYENENAAACESVFARYEKICEQADLD